MEGFFYLFNTEKISSRVKSRFSSVMVSSVNEISKTS